LYRYSLDPAAYARDCLAAFGRVIDPAGNAPFLTASPSPSSSSDVSIEVNCNDDDETGAYARDAEAAARALWALAAPQCPFDLEDALLSLAARKRDDAAAANKGSSVDTLQQDLVTLLPPDIYLFSPSCDLLGSAGRQGGFLWQVLPARYGGRDAPFLRAAAERYLMLCGLWRRHPREFLVPTYDIDLAWHAHMSFPRWGTLYKLNPVDPP
jgi:hypothetical protein